MVVERSDPFQETDSLPVLARPAPRVSPAELPASDIRPALHSTGYREGKEEFASESEENYGNVVSVKSVSDELSMQEGSHKKER